MLPSLFAFLLSSYFAVCFAQQANQPASTQKYTVTGSVVNAVTGEPIRRALVTMNGALAFTGADGRFELGNVPDGLVMAAAQKPGFFDCSAVPCPGQKQQGPTQFAIHANKDDVVLKLVPEARIEGRVTDESGDPISNMTITARSEQVSDGRKQLNNFRTAATDENGDYEISELMPGTYKLQTAMRPTFMVFANVRNAPRPEIYAPRFYPNAPDESSAQNIELKGGESAQAAFTLTSAPAYRISGTIQPPGQVFLTADDGESQQVQIPFRMIQEGKFIIPYIPAGTWTLHFHQQPMNMRGRMLVAGSQAQQYYAEATVTVGSTDIQNLAVVMQPLPTIEVHTGSASNEDSQMASVQLTSREGNESYGGGRQGGPDSPYQITNVRPGRYSVTVFGGNECVDTVTSGNIDLTHDDFVVSPESQNQTINVTLRKDCSSLAVTPHTADPSSTTYLLLLATSRAIDPQQIQLTGSGPFTFRNLSPGDYQVYAFANVDGLEYTNPEVMRQFTGQQVTLSPNQQGAITVDVIARGEQ